MLSDWGIETVPEDQIFYLLYFIKDKYRREDAWNYVKNDILPCKLGLMTPIRR